MATKISKNIFGSFSYEVIERAIRFLLHLEEIRIQFYCDKKQSTSQYDLINSYEETLSLLLKMAINIYKNCPDDTEIIGVYFKTQKEILGSINELHSKWLSILPRPKEPVELIRFQRVIQKQVVMLDSNKQADDFTISVNEKLGEEIYNNNPLSKYIDDNINPIIEEYNQTSNIKVDNIKTDKSCHITIPRLDATNTLRWPSLLHEMSHEFYDPDLFSKNGILEEFFDHIGIKTEEEETLFLDMFTGIIPFNENKNNSLNYVSIWTREEKTKHLKSWLIECWCDLFACILIGPAFYFSQFLAFLHSTEKNEKRSNLNHPPAMFRLFLIRKIIECRFPSVFNELEPHYKSCEELTRILDSDSISFFESDDLPYIYNSFDSFFRAYFFSSELGNINAGTNTELNKEFKKISQKYVHLTSDISKYLVTQLKAGYPIPSIKTISESGGYFEYPTYVQEVFYASWISRVESLQESVFNIIESFTTEEIKESLFSKLRQPIERHDQAILKSIQISEWFDFFIDEKERPEKFDIWKNQVSKDTSRGLLVDEQIKDLIYSNEMQFIPLMDIQEQLGTTSLDVRLGACFQMFYPNQYGIIDFTENEKKHREISKRINLDFLEGITITPGQFLLAHSLEYIKLPNDISGSLDGRSSFARLGLEIHMTAGFIDPGFEGVITFEIYNAGASAIKLYPGLRIGQLRLERNSTPQKIYKDRHTVKYKGLLEHYTSKQSSDVEIDKIKKYKSSKL